MPLYLREEGKEEDDATENIAENLDVVESILLEGLQEQLVGGLGRDEGLRGIGGRLFGLNEGVLGEVDIRRQGKREGKFVSILCLCFRLQHDRISRYPTNKVDRYIINNLIIREIDIQEHLIINNQCSLLYNRIDHKSITVTTIVICVIIGIVGIIIGVISVSIIGIGIVGFCIVVIRSIIVGGVIVGGVSVGVGVVSVGIVSGVGVGVVVICCIGIGLISAVGFIISSSFYAVPSICHKSLRAYRKTFVP